MHPEYTGDSSSREQNNLCNCFEKKIMDFTHVY